MRRSSGCQCKHSSIGEWGPGALEQSEQERLMYSVPSVHTSVYIYVHTDHNLALSDTKTLHRARWARLLHEALLHFHLAKLSWDLPAYIKLPRLWPVLSASRTFACIQTISMVYHELLWRLNKQYGSLGTQSPNHPRVGRSQCMQGRKSPYIRASVQVLEGSRT